MDTYKNRILEVQYWQNLYGMKSRKDSRLTEIYGKGLLGMSADEVARELVATHFIFSYSLYGELIEEFMRYAAARLRNEYNLSWKSTWEIIRCYAPIALKLMCVSSGNLHIPQRLNEIPPGELEQNDQTQFQSEGNLESES